MIKLLQYFQNFLITGWLWHMYRQTSTGHIVLMPKWRKPPAGFIKYQKD